MNELLRILDWPDIAGQTPVMGVISHLAIEDTRAAQIYQVMNCLWRIADLRYERAVLGLFLLLGGSLLYPLS